MTILCYHAVDPDWGSPLAVDPLSFAEQCNWLTQHRQVVSLQDAVGRLDGSGRLPRGMAALTFDDGFSSLYDHAMPILRRYGLPATVFLVAKTLSAGGQSVDWVDFTAGHELSTLNRDQVLEMQSAGVDFESHSYAHLDLTTLGFSNCVDDLRDSRELLESVLGRPVSLLAYPRGRHNDEVRKAAARAGYRNAFTLPEGGEAVGPFSIPRVGVYRGNGMRILRVKAARPYLTMRTSRAYRLVAQVRPARSGGRG